MCRQLEFVAQFVPVIRANDYHDLATEFVLEFLVLARFFSLQYRFQRRAGRHHYFSYLKVPMRLSIMAMRPHNFLLARNLMLVGTLNLLLSVK